VFFLDEFLWDYCNDKSFIDREEFLVNNFIDPYIKHKEGTALKYLEAWLESDDFILVVKGDGGIGKTTLVKKMSEIINRGYLYKKVIFIDVVAMKGNLIRYVESLDHDMDLYDLYVACGGAVSNGVDFGLLGKELFHRNFELGNIVVVVDGLDEIISRYSHRFDFDSFLSSLEEYISGGETGGVKGKVVFTCRNFFWDEMDFNYSKNMIELAPFDGVLARQYFLSCFDGDKRFAEKGIWFANQLMLKGKDEEYIPFVLDIIKKILRDTSGGEKLRDVSFVSDILDLNNKYDYIVYRICDREAGKHDLGLDVDMQVRFFMNIACEQGAFLKRNLLQSVLTALIGKPVTDEAIKALLSHPILELYNEELRFRYQFFEWYFRVIFLYEFFCTETEFNDAVKNILLEKMSVSFINDVSNRVALFSDDIDFKFMSLIESVKSSIDIKTSDKEKVISSIFLMALKVQAKAGSLSKQNNTKLLQDYFSLPTKRQILQNVAIIGISGKDMERFIFDFRGLTIKDSVISEYDYFWMCDFNDYTLFDRCRINSNHVDEKVSTTAKPSNFMNNCVLDDTAKIAIQDAKEHIKAKLKSLVDDLKCLLRIFYVRGVMMPQTEVKIKSLYKGKVECKTCLKILYDGGVIDKYMSKKETLGSQWHIKEEYRQACVDFCLQGVMFNELNDLIEIALKK
jgi:energy-coupling factor transporter ATP-binding protein EcfA2